MTGHGTSSQNAKKGVNVTFVITNLHLPTLPIINSTSAAPHSLKEDSEEVQKLISPGSKQQTLQCIAPQYTQQQLEVFAAAESFRPFNWCEKRYFRLAFSPSIRSAEVLERETEMLADKLREEAAALFKNNMCTLAFDSGTVWNRYLCLVLCCSSVGNLFLGAFADEHLPSHTTEAVSQALRDTIIPFVPSIKNKKEGKQNCSSIQNKKQIKTRALTRESKTDGVDSHHPTPHNNLRDAATMASASASFNL